VGSDRQRNRRGRLGRLIVTTLPRRYASPAAPGALITEAAPVERILLALGEPPRPPLITPARGPAAWDDAPEPMPNWDLVAQPELEFD
jgi:hypothetical protein